MRRTVEAALNSIADIVLVVLGSEEKKHKLELSDQDHLHIVSNKSWERGMGSSLKIGLKKLLDLNPEIKAAIFSVCDQPYITSSIFNDLINESRIGNKNAITSRYKNNAIGVPVLFKNDLFSSILTIEDEAGAKYILKEKSGDLGYVEFPRGYVDVDTLSDYHDILVKINENKFL